VEEVDFETPTIQPVRKFIQDLRDVAEDMYNVRHNFGTYDVVCSAFMENGELAIGAAWPVSPNEVCISMWVRAYDGDVSVTVGRVAKIVVVG